ncbi:MAG: hypothetical protein IJA61_00195 [Clostridia bacterium]|nr:hypothetical protein [Clostridia bacterium]
MIYKIKSRYLIKCEIPGCANIALNMFSTNKIDENGFAICEKCIKGIIEKYKKSVERKNEKEN